MLSKFTDKYRFTINLNLSEKNLEVVKQAKLMGVIISDDLILKNGITEKGSIIYKIN